MKGKIMDIIIELIKSNYDITVCISLVSLLFSVFAFNLGKKSAKLSSYNQRGAYEVLLLKRKLNINKSFEVKIFNSIKSKTFPFNYKLVVHSQLGGIYRAMKFNVFCDQSSIGIIKVLPKNNILPRFTSFKRYAYNTNIYFESSPLVPYFTARANFTDSINGKLMLNRYYFYLEITDYCNNTEIWYISFSLLLSNFKDYNLEWKHCYDCYGYKYYAYDDVCIVSPKDIIMNFNRINGFDENLDDILDIDRNNGESKSLKNNGYEGVRSKLQLYEMKKYHNFIKKLNDEKIISNS